MTPAALSVARRLCRSRSLVVGGHGVARVPEGMDPHNLCVDPDCFRGQVELLLAAGFEFVTLAELAGAGPPAPGRVALTFDDGMHDNLSLLLGLLEEYAITATVFVTTGLMGAPNPWLDRRAGARMLTGDEVCALARAGIEIGAHTVTHPDLTQLADADCRREVAESRAVLRALTGTAVTSFAYPFFRCGPATVAAVREAGFSAAVTGPRRGGWSPLEIDRAMITGLDGIPAFLAKLGGVYDPVFRSTPGRLVRGATRGPRLLARRARADRQAV